MHAKTIPAALAAALSAAAAVSAHATTYLDSGYYCFTNGVRCVYQDGDEFVSADPQGRSLFDAGSTNVYWAIPPKGCAIDKWVMTDFARVNQTFALSGLSPVHVYETTDGEVSEGGYRITVSWRDEFVGAGSFLQICPCFLWLKYRLRFVPNWPGHNDEDRSLAQDDVVYTNTVTLAADPFDTNDWTRANYRLLGLATIPDADRPQCLFGDTVESAGEEFGATTNGVVTLYGVWSPRRVTLSLDPDGGSVASNAVYVVGDDKCPALPVPAKALSTFAGWFDTKGNEFSEGVEVVAEDGETLALTAKWLSDESSVVLDRRSGTTGDTSIHVVFGESLPLAEMPTREGYDFAGYFSLANGKGDQYYTASGEPTNTISRGGAKTLYANWTRKKSRVTLDAAGGSGGTSEVSAEYDKDMPEISVPTRKGFVFGGYYTFTSGGTVYYNSSGKSANPWRKVSPATLYAHWTPNNYKIVYDYAGGVAGDYQPANATFCHVFAAGVPRRKGYRFIGYRVSGDFDVEAARYGASMESATSAVKSTTNCKGAEGKPFVYFANLCSANDGTVVLTAQWEKIVEAAASGSKNVAAVPNMARQDVAHRAFVKNGNDDERGDLSRAADCNFKLTTSGARPWTVTNDYATGSESVCSTILPSDQYAKGLIIGEVEGPGILTFQWKWMINSKSTYSNEESGGVEFSYSNAVEEVKCTDFRCSNDWTTVSLVITNILNKEVTTFKWTANPYKDQNGEYPGYTVWLDDIHWEQKLPKLHVVASSPVEFVYDGSGHGITNIVVKDEGTDEPVANATVKYSLTQDDEFNGEPLLFTNVCTTSVWYSVEAYGYASITDSVTVIIHKATNEWTKLPYITPEWVSGNAPAVTNGVARFGGEASLSYYCTTNKSSKISKDPDKTTKPGEYIAVFTVAGSDNWSELTTNLSFRVTESESGSESEPDPEPPPGPEPELPKLLAEASPNPVDVVYDGEGHGITNVSWRVDGTNTVDATNVVVRYALSREGPFYNYPELFTNACETLAWYSVTADGYVGVTNSVSVTISQATNEWTELPSVKDWTAGDDDAVKFGESKFGAIEVMYSTGSSEPPTEYGEYEVRVSVAGTESWTGLSTNMSFRVKAKPVFSAFALSCEGAYDGTGHGIEVVYDKAGVGSATVKYASSKDGPYLDENIMFVNAMAEPVTVWFTVERNGYATVTNSGTIMIHKAPNGWLAGPSISGWRNGDEPHEGVAVAEYGTVSGAYATNNAPCTATFTVAETANWLGLSTNLEFVVEGLPPSGGDGDDQGGGEEKPDPDPTPTPDPSSDPEPTPTPAPGPEPGPTPEPAVSGVVLNTAFSKAQTVLGALYRADGALAGVMQVKFGKVSRKGFVKVSGTATLLSGKKVSAKTSSMALGGGMSGEVVFRSPIDAMDFIMDESGAFVMANEAYVMKEAVVGGGLADVAHGAFGLVDEFDLAVTGELQEDLLPLDFAFQVERGKWKFPKNATVKIAKDRATGEYGRLVDYGRKGDKTNVSSLKLSYTAKTGVFKGSFKAYATEAPGGRLKLKKYTVNVYGFVLDGDGVGVATCKRPEGGPWEVSVELK